MPAETVKIIFFGNLTPCPLSLDKERGRECREGLRPSVSGTPVIREKRDFENN
jgi:hypothetical protein